MVSTQVYKETHTCIPYTCTANTFTSPGGWVQMDEDRQVMNNITGQQYKTNIFNSQQISSYATAEDKTQGVIRYSILFGKWLYPLRDPINFNFTSKSLFQPFAGWTASGFQTQFSMSQSSQHTTASLNIFVSCSSHFFVWHLSILTIFH